MTQAHKCECPAATGNDAENPKTYEPYFAPGERNIKAISVLRAQLALHDHAIHAMLCGDFLVYTSSRTSYCKDFKSLQAFAHRLGVNK